jgi:tRNA pseudouridine38-40 synthase
MAAAARLVEGAHDFVAFQSAGGRTRTTTREIFSSRIDSQPGHPLITYEVCGSGFLKYMVRTIVGSLVEVGRGRQRPEWMSAAIASKSRAAAGPTAPPQGLFLVRVDYGDTGSAGVSRPRVEDL